MIVATAPPTCGSYYHTITTILLKPYPVNLKQEILLLLIPNQDGDFGKHFRRVIAHIQRPAPELGLHCLKVQLNLLPFVSPSIRMVGIR